MGASFFLSMWYRNHSNLMITSLTINYTIHKEDISAFPQLHWLSCGMLNIYVCALMKYTALKHCQNSDVTLNIDEYINIMIYLNNII